MRASAPAVLVLLSILAADFSPAAAAAPDRQDVRLVAGAPRRADSWSPAVSDPGFVRRVLEESGVDQRVPAPSWSAYPQTLLEALMRGVEGILQPLGPRVLRQVRWLAAALTGVALLLLLVVSTRAFLRRRPKPKGVSAPSLAQEAGEPGHRGDCEAWRRAFEERCAAGDVAGALEALWWYLATSLAPHSVDPAWTSRELLVETKREELMPLARNLDRMIYGSRRPVLDELDQFFGQLRHALA